MTHAQLVPPPAPRSAFQKIGLSEYCKFISIEELDELIGKVGEFQGHVQPTVVDSIATELDSDAANALA